MPNKDNLFYIQKEIEDSLESNSFYKKIKDFFFEYRQRHNVPVYMLNKVLSKIDEEYSEEIENQLEHICIVLIPDYNPLIIKTSNLNEEIFEDYLEQKPI